MAHKKVDGKAHPNISEIFEEGPGIISDETWAAWTGRQSTSSFIESDQQISALFEQFKDGQYHLSDFLDAIKYQSSISSWSRESWSCGNWSHERKPLNEAHSV